MERRDFLQMMALAAPALTVSGRLFAAPPGSPRFLLVFLRGGYDCANVVIPYSSSYYYESRPNIAVAKPTGPDATEGAVALDADWALAPVLRTSIAPLYKNRQALFIPFAGTDDLSRSHFETQDSIELGQPLQGSHDLRSGFLSRLAGVLKGADPIAFTDSLPVCFRGDTDIPNISLKGVGKPVFDTRQASILSDMYSGHPLQSKVADGLELRQEVGRALEMEMKEASRDAISPKGFELEARRVGRLMRDQYRIGFIDVGGWDTHVNEGAAQGALANNVESLGRGLAAMSQELGGEWRNTVVAVVSEFGRTFRENGNKGTDHGHGSVHWLLGGSINGGRIAGEQTRVAKASLFQDRDYPVLNEYRAVLGGLFGTLWGLSADQVQRVFPGSTSVNLQLV
ncbi:MAG TPA: DUF1501 domain-containing protein [Steroidobacteraceae bacterium]